MRIALCTTTIHVPTALQLMREFNPDVRFFVATDEKTPDHARDFVHTIKGVETFGEIRSSVWKCSDAIGWNTLARRNIAFLEALKWGADVIYSWDNDNLPTGEAHFDYLAQPFHGFSGIKLTSDSGWLDPGQLLAPQVRHRGFPYQKPPSKIATTKVGAKVGVAAGLVIGDPDIDASTRIETRPDVGQVHILGAMGVVVDLHTWTVFNAQNTAIVRELAPAFFQMPGVGRHDDIYASLIMQRVARERGYHVHFGPPFTYQQRNTHDQLIDLRAEIDGMETVSKMAEYLDHIPLLGKSVREDVQHIYSSLYVGGFIGDLQRDSAYAYLDDCEGLGL